MIKTILAGIAFLCASLTCFGQKIPEPEVIGYVHYNDAGVTKKMDRQLYSRTNKDVYFEGVNSSSQIKQKDTITFIVRVLDQQRNPTTVIRLFQLERSEKMDARILPTKKDRAGNFKIRLIDYDNLIPIDFQFEEYDKNSFKILIPNLAPGSYAIKITDDRFDWNLFDIIE